MTSDSVNQTEIDEQTVEVVNRAGMHARPAAEFVKVAGGYSARIFVAKDGLEVNGKSIMGVLMLAAEKGSSLTIRAEGEDAPEAVAALAELVARGFDEDLGSGESPGTSA